MVDRYSSTGEGVHLAAEQKEFINPDPTARPQTLRGREPIRFDRSWPDLDGSDADREQLVGYRLRTLCFPESGDECTTPVATAESILDHSGQASLKRVDFAEEAQDFAQAGQAVFGVTQGAADEAHVTILVAGCLGNV